MKPKKLLRILIIEDNLDHVEILSSAIERNFAPVDLHTVESINDALDFLEETHYDLIFTDCYLNNASIVDQIPSLRERVGETPIIVVTGSGDESLAAQVIKKGATDYLVKTKDSAEKIPVLIRKYVKQQGGAGKSAKAPRLKEKLLNEVATLDRHAKRITSHQGGRIPDMKQLESLLDQIKHLKELASKLIEK